MSKSQRNTIKENQNIKWRIQIPKINLDVHIMEGSVGTTLHTKDLLEQKGLLNTSCEEGQITWMNTMDPKIELSKCLFKKLEVEL